MYDIKTILLTYSILAGCEGVHQPDTWRPFHQPGADFFHDTKTTFFDQGFENEAPKDQCALHKVAFTQDLYFQYIQYKTDIPDMKQFTLCFWTKFYNHSNDHPIFSYAVDGQPKAIYSWVSNTERSSYFSLSVDKHTFYRLNYPLRLNRWYHTCQSWNGKTGEWQIWVNAERVGRGFHNRLVGHTIPGGGLAITGQEQRQLGGGFEEGPLAPKGSGGMLGEITMLQLYRVALTAGKAHKDHKHHHAHQFDHNGMIITTPAPTTPVNRPTLPPHPLLTGGQINPNVKINVAAIQAQQQPQIVQGQNFNAQYLNGQFVGNILAQQFQSQQPQQQQQQDSFSSQYLSLGDQPVVNTGLNHVYGDNSVHSLFKRTNDKETAIPSRKTKRQIYDLAGGSILEDTRTSSYAFDQSLLNGLAGIGQNGLITEKQKQTEEEREPAEAEVKAVRNVCNGCDEEPFDKALVFGWRSVDKKLYSGAYYTLAVPECKVF